MTGHPTSQPRQAEAALPALLKARSVAVLAAGADPGHNHAVHIQGDTEGETSVSLRNKLELLWRGKQHVFVCVFARSCPLGLKTQGYSLVRFMTLPYDCSRSLY